MEGEDENVRWIRECYRRQYFLSFCLMSCTFLRWISCSQLQYLTDYDFMTAGTVCLNAFIVHLFANTIKKHDLNGQQLPPVVCVLAAFNFVFSFFVLMSTFETFRVFVDLLACERLAFEKIRWTEFGVVGEIQKCPWPMPERMEYCHDMCRLDNRSMEMIAKKHWKRSFGLFTNDLVLFFLAVIIVSIVETCVPSSKIVFQYFCRPSEIENEPTIENDHVGTNDYQGSPWLFLEGKSLQSAPVVDPKTPPPPYEV